MLFCLVLAALFVSAFSYGTSPFYVNHAFSDSAMFQVIGKGWAEGSLPYVDLWDSKGPLIFFINALGFLLTGSATGIYIIQILSLTITFAVCYVWMCDVFGRRGAVLSCILLFLALPLNYDFGNMTEEYLLPLLMLSFYLIYKWATESYDNGNMEHPARYSLIYGALLGCSLMTRLTNAVGVLTAVAFICVCLVYKRLWFCLLRNALFFLIGFIVVVLPFVVYFGSKGILHDMWYGTFIYNVKYASHSLSHLTPDMFVYGFYRYAPCMLLVAVSLLIFVRYRKAMLWLSVSAVTLVYLLMSLGFYHYGMICLPYLCVSVVLLFKYLSLPRLRLKVTCVAVLMFFSYTFIDKLYFALTNKNDFIADYNEMIASVPPHERSSIMSYGCDAGFYVWFDMLPEYRFFTFQDWAASNDTKLVGELRKEFSDGDVKYILFCGNPDNTYIGDIMSRRYEIIKRNPSADLWLLRLR